jgi:large subunit ribosomal protein L18
MATLTQKTEKRERRHHRIRAKVVGTALRPRLCVYRSNKFIYAQIINDETATTLAAYDSRTATGTGSREKARVVGTEVAKRAQAAGVTAVVFDRGGFLYTGMVKELADAAREAGLQF